jgi:hypothetical protein
MRLVSVLVALVSLGTLGCQTPNSTDLDTAAPAPGPYANLHPETKAKGFILKPPSGARPTLGARSGG